MRFVTILLRYRQHRATYFAAAVGGSFLLVLLGGCNNGPALAPVSGRVTLDGKPLSMATVTFLPNHGRASHGQTDSDGHYELLYDRTRYGALIGRHDVRIISATEITMPDGRFFTRPQIIPQRYNAHTELHEEVKPGENTFNFALKSNPKKK